MPTEEGNVRNNSLELARVHPMLNVFAVTLLTVIFGTLSVRAETPDNQLPKDLADMGVTEHLGDSIPLNLEFRDEKGNIVRLGQYFHDRKPVILSFNYSNCPMLCSLQLTGLVNGLKDVELTCGKDYEFVSVSIDPHELPQRAAQTKQRYYQMYGRKDTSNGWHFLVGSQESITALTKAAGVSYRYLKDKKEYVHPAVCVGLTPDGRLSRYLYGIEFAPQTLRLGLVESGEGTIGTTLDQVLLFCFHYDADKGRYAPTARRLMSIGGALTAVGLGLFLLSQYRKELRLRRIGNANTPGNPGLAALTLSSTTEFSDSPNSLKF